MPAKLTESSFRRSVRYLTHRDPRLASSIRAHGHPPFWHRTPGFASLILLVLEQQVSLASARAAFDRLATRAGAVSPRALLTLDGEALREVGFSRQKAGYARSLAKAVIDGFDLDGLSGLEDADVRRELMAHPGIGSWTADVYLLSCLRRPDVWPAGDRALQVGTAEVLDLGSIPDPERLEELAEAWRPHRATAARVIWHVYLSRRGRTAPVRSGRAEPGA